MNKASAVKKLFAVLALCLTGTFVFGQQKNTISAGLLVEANANTRHGYGLAGGLMADYGLFERIALGIKADYGSDFYDVSSFETMGFGRFYFLKTPVPMYVQAGAGIIGLFEDQKKVFSVLGDAAVGVRFPIGSRFYTEQYLRGGWPSGFGFGMVVGCRFELKTKAVAMSNKLKDTFGDEFVELQDGSILYMPVILFMPNTAQTEGLPPETLESNASILYNVVIFLTQHPDYNVMIIGYANPVLGTEKENRELLVPLSSARAETIRKELIERGVEGGRITTFGAGGREADASNWMSNRRVQFHFSKTRGR